MGKIIHQLRLLVVSPGPRLDMGFDAAFTNHDVENADALGRKTPDCAAEDS